MIVAVAVGLVVAAIGAGAVLALGRDDKREIKGAFFLSPPEDLGGGPDDCEGSGRDDDVSAGVNVTVKNREGRIVGSGELHNASVDETAERLVNVDDSPVPPPAAVVKEILAEHEGEICTLLFEIEVRNADFYEIEIGLREKLSYSKKELDKRNWYVSAGPPD
jgi:hypothetical protein